VNTASSANSSILDPVIPEQQLSVITPTQGSRRDGDSARAAAAAIHMREMKDAIARPWP
jgi:hypothetical protein